MEVIIINAIASKKQPEMTKVFQYLPDLHEGNIKNYPNILKFAESTTD